MGAADDIRTSVATAWVAFRAAMAEGDLERTTPAGWTRKELAAHAAFWLETVPPFVTGAFRGDESAFSLVFPSGYDTATDEVWPEADVHNAREAEWARTQPGDAVLARLDAAYEASAAFLETVTDDEATTHAEYFADIARHLDEHRTEELS